MKTFLNVFVLLVMGSFANAEVKAPGTLVPVMCAKTVKSADNDIVSVCFARKVAMDGEYLTITTASGGGAVFPIIAMTPGNSGVTGANPRFSVTVITQGDIAVRLNATGRIGAVKTLSGTISEKYSFYARDFEAAVITM